MKISHMAEVYEFILLIKKYTEDLKKVKRLLSNEKKISVNNLNYYLKIAKSIKKRYKKIFYFNLRIKQKSCRVWCCC